MYRPIFSILFIFILFSCKKDKNPIPVPPVVQVPAKTELNIPYGNDVLQKMDFYLPENRSTNTKVVIMIHGGGWSQGDKTDFNGYVDTLKKRNPGYAIVNMNYRLASNIINLFPTQENDVKTAIEFIYNKRAEYIYSDQFVLLGASAGGHLSLLHAYKYQSPVKIKAVIDFYGPTDMVDMYNNPASPFIPSTLIASIVGGTPATNPTLYFQSSPINFISAQCPPTIIFHGGADILVSPNQSLALKNKLQLFSVPNEYYLYPLENHVWVGPNLTDSFNKIDAFLNNYVN